MVGFYFPNKYFVIVGKKHLFGIQTLDHLQMSFFQSGKMWQRYGLQLISLGEKDLCQRELKSGDEMVEIDKWG